MGMLLQQIDEVNDKRNQLQLDGERLFSDMDQHNMGFISINNFANWVCDNCGFHICDEDLPLLETSLDGMNDYRVTREGFIDTVSTAREEEDAEQDAS